MNADAVIALVITGAIGLLLAVMGVVLLLGHGAFLIAGYNTMPTEARAKYDQRALCRFTGKLLLALAPCCPGIGLGAVLDWVWLTIASVTVLLVAVGWAVVYANTKGRFLK